MKPTAEHYSGARAEVLTEAFNGLLLVNGGGVIALLAFLQQQWTAADKTLPMVLLGGAVCMVVGLIAALPIPLLRYSHSRLWENKEALEAEGKAEAEADARKRKRRRSGYFACYIVSMLGFTAGAAYVVCRAFAILSLNG